MGLAIPIAATQVFDRVVPSPDTPTLFVLCVCVLGIAVMEAILRFGRTYLVAQAGASYGWAMTYGVFKHVCRADLDGEPLRASSSLQLISAIQQTKEKYNGQIMIGFTEMLFLPVILGAVFFISPIAGLIILICMLGLAAFSYFISLRLNDVVHKSTETSEENYSYLFSVLDSMHSVKALAIEEYVTRGYESMQGKLTRYNHEAARLVGRLLNSVPITNQITTVCVLAFGAYGVSSGQMSMGAVSALILLSNRVMAPLQRGIFILIQLKEVKTDEQKLLALFDRPVSAVPLEGLQVENEGSVDVDGLDYVDPGTKAKLVSGVTFSLNPGETMVVRAAAEKSATALLHVIAGIRQPSHGFVRLNGVAPSEYPPKLRNECVGYISSHPVLLRGTIRDNITRFGEASVDEALEVAHLLEIDAAINELPNGLDTELFGGTFETIPPGMRQQICIVRALTMRPKLILFDNADRGLDKQGYARLVSFLGKLQGQATTILVSDDANLTSRQGKNFRFVDGTLVADDTPLAKSPVAYRTLPS